MKKFLLFVAGLIAAFILIANVGPMLLLGVSIWLIYLIFKQFVKANTTMAKAGWLILGLVVLSIGISNSFSVIGIAAAIALYYIIKHWKKEESSFPDGANHDPFLNFEEQWGEIK